LHTLDISACNWGFASHSLTKEDHVFVSAIYASILQNKKICLKAWDLSWDDEELSTTHRQLLQALCALHPRIAAHQCWGRASLTPVPLFVPNFSLSLAHLKKYDVEDITNLFIFDDGEDISTWRKMWRKQRMVETVSLGMSLTTHKQDEMLALLSDIFRKNYASIRKVYCRLDLCEWAPKDLSPFVNLSLFFEKGTKEILAMANKEFEKALVSLWNIPTVLIHLIKSYWRDLQWEYADEDTIGQQMRVEWKHPSHRRDLMCCYDQKRILFYECVNVNEGWKENFSTTLCKAHLQAALV